MYIKKVYTLYIQKSKACYNVVVAYVKSIINVDNK